MFLMNLSLIRTNLTAESTEGDLLVDGVWECYTLELPMKDGLPGSAIPPGVYIVKLLPSPKFSASADPWVLQYAGAIPHVLGIPNRSDILMHWGNSPHDTEGCILVGQTQGENFVGSSRTAFAGLWLRLSNVPAGEIISLTVNGGRTSAPLGVDEATQV